MARNTTDATHHNGKLMQFGQAACAPVQVAARATSADSLAESEVSATLPDSADEESDDSDASDGEDTEWEPQQGAPPPVADGVTKLAEGTLDADVKEVYSRLLADQVCLLLDRLVRPHSSSPGTQHRRVELQMCVYGCRCDGALQPIAGTGRLSQA